MNWNFSDLLESTSKKIYIPLQTLLNVIVKSKNSRVCIEKNLLIIFFDIDNTIFSFHNYFTEPLQTLVLDFCDLKKLFGRFENFFWVDDYQLFIEVHKVLKVFSRVRIEKVWLVLVSKKVYISIMKSY